MERFYLTAEIIIPKYISDDSEDGKSKEKERKFKESYKQKIINFLGEVPIKERITNIIKKIPKIRERIYLTWW